jgi:nitrogenase molybdenum-iron protein alpha/beta subunit
MKVYIAGAISNNPNYKEQFAEAEEFLKKIGYTVLNPVKNLGFEYKDYIDMGLCELMKCDAIYLLPNYQESQGAMLEYQYAITVGLKMVERSNKE